MVKTIGTSGNVEKPSIFFRSMWLIVAEYESYESFFDYRVVSCGSIQWANWSYMFFASQG